MTENCKLRKAILSAFYNILQKKLWNITNFVMLFQAVMKFLSRLVEFNILVNWGMVHYFMVSVFGWPDPNTRECCES